MIQAKIVGDSLSPQGHRLTSMLITMPRIILSELNTHRMLSKNSASSRAIPFNKMIEMVKTNPFIPIAWQKEHKGMQGTEYLTNDLIEIRNQDTNQFRMAGRVDLAIAQHLSVRDSVIEWATYQTEIGVTKQIANRYLEPFMWHTVLISGTEWENFFKLRCPQYDISEYEPDSKGKIYRSRKDVAKDWYNGNTTDYSEIEWLKLNKGQAEIHMMALAEAMWDAMNESKPKQLKAGEWHIPFEDKINLDEISKMLMEPDLIGSSIQTKERYLPELIKVSTVMGARTSYTVVGSDQKPLTIERTIELHNEMATAKPFHASPFEHCAIAMDSIEYYRFMKGEYKIGNKFIDLAITSNEDIYGWCRNFRGFIQYRHILETKGNNQYVIGVDPYRKE
jgi:hypothetical protein